MAEATNLSAETSNLLAEAYFHFAEGHFSLAEGYFTCAVIYFVKPIGVCALQTISGRIRQSPETFRQAKSIAQSRSSKQPLITKRAPEKKSQKPYVSGILGFVSKAPSLIEDGFIIRIVLLLICACSLDKNCKISLKY